MWKCGTYLVIVVILFGEHSVFAGEQALNLNEGANDLLRVRRQANSGQEPDFLRAAEANLQNDRNEQNFRSLFNKRDGQQEFNNEALRRIPGSPSPQSSQRFQDGARGPDGTTGRGDPLSRRIQTPSCIYDPANQLPCSSIYREPTGRCTNTGNGRKAWGMAGTPFNRILRPLYEDGTGARRVTEFTSSKTLPSPRTISATVTTNRVILNFAGVSSHVMQWGQFIAHEFTQLAESSATAACCPDQIFNSTYGRGRKPTPADLQTIRDALERFRGDICQQIENENDPEYGEDVCMNHVRSKATPLHNCAPGPREQMNSITQIFDASNVYGSSKSEMEALRDSFGGRLKIQRIRGVDLPPPDFNNCPQEKRNINQCPFLGGDNRINTTPNLISAHTAFINKHNQIADELSRINTHWDNEKLFQETRKIVSGIQSNIHFYEWLPIVIGAGMINRYGLQSYAGLDTNINPSIPNELAGAAMRFGHSLINGIFSLEKDNGLSHSANLRPSFFDSDIIYRDGTRQCARGLSKDVPWKVDRNFPTQMRDFLFDQKRDIVSLNINRGRDHGFRSYVDYRRHYGLRVPSSFNDLSSTHSNNVIEELRKVYSSVNDVELYVAGVTEFPVSGGLVGELFANILADGFSNTIKGDRFYFESSQSGLTASQIAAIKGYKYAQLLCEGHSLTRTLSKGFFTRGSRGSQEVACSSFPRLNLNLWREQPTNPTPSVPVPTPPTRPTPPTPFTPAPTPPTPPGNCSWRVRRRQRCCRGSRNIVRTCVNQSFSCQCQGSTITTEPCTCTNRRCRRGFCARRSTRTRRPPRRRRPRRFFF